MCRLAKFDARVLSLCEGFDVPPRCGSVSSAELRLAFAAGGAVMGDAEWVEVLEALRADERGRPDYGHALRRLAAAERLWPLLPDARSDGYDAQAGAAAAALLAELRRAGGEIGTHAQMAPARLRAAGHRLGILELAATYQGEM